MVDPGVPTPAPEPVATTDGFDESLFAQLLAMSAEERLRLNDRTISLIKELRRGFGIADDAAGRAAGR